MEEGREIEGVLVVQLNPQLDYTPIILDSEGYLGNVNATRDF